MDGGTASFSALREQAETVVKWLILGIILTNLPVEGDPIDQGALEEMPDA